MSCPLVGHRLRSKRKDVISTVYVHPSVHLLETEYQWLNQVSDFDEILYRLSWQQLLGMCDFLANFSLQDLHIMWLNVEFCKICCLEGHTWLTVLNEIWPYFLPRFVYVCASDVQNNRLNVNFMQAILYLGA